MEEMKTPKPYNTDLYKVCHYEIGYKKNDLTNIQCHVQARAKEKDAHVLFFGAQIAIKDIFENGPPTKEEINYAEKLFKETIISEKNPFNKEGWGLLADYGYYPLEIKAVEEGKVYPANFPLMTIKLDPEITAQDRKNLTWLVPYFEPGILQNIWHPTNAATKSFECKKVIWKHLEKTGNTDEVTFKLHDFGFRGVSSEESAAKGGLGHLVNFEGTDTIVANVAAKKYYNAKEIVGKSIRAIEHNNVLQFGKEREVEAYRQAVKLANEGPISIVIDAWDDEGVIEKYMCGELKENIINAKYPVIIRTDSGIPEKVVPKIMKMLEKGFGTEVNEKGYKVLNHVRMIHGDKIDGPETIDKILDAVEKKGYSADNLAFGMGGALLQKHNRDTFGFTMKASAIQKNDGDWEEVYKMPKNAPGKKTLAGLFDDIPELETIFENGKVVKKLDFDEIRKNAHSYFVNNDEIIHTKNPVLWE
jgi:nicotinamide phosphoribosyltransferase